MNDPSSIDHFIEKGVTLRRLIGLREWAVFISQQIEPIIKSLKINHPWDLLELHNPWSRAGIRVDSWGFLDICQTDEILNVVSSLIGPDIILFDSLILPNVIIDGKNKSDLLDDAVFFPVDPLAGVVIRIPIETKPDQNLQFRYQPITGSRKSSDGLEQLLDVIGEHAIIHHPGVRYRYEFNQSSIYPLEYVIRYFPATSSYIRDPAHPTQRNLMENYPLVNFIRKPLWLVCGIDKAENDFVTGFQSLAGQWTQAKQ